MKWQKGQRGQWSGSCWADAHATPSLHIAYFNFSDMDMIAQHSSLHLHTPLHVCTVYPRGLHRRNYGAGRGGGYNADSDDIIPAPPLLGNHSVLSHK